MNAPTDSLVDQVRDTLLALHTQMARALLQQPWGLDFRERQRARAQAESNTDLYEALERLRTEPAPAPEVAAATFWFEQLAEPFAIRRSMRPRAPSWVHAIVASSTHGDCKCSPRGRISCPSARRKRARW